MDLNDVKHDLTKNTAMVMSLVGAILSVGAAIYVFAFPNEKLGRGVVTLFALFTILIACAYLYTTHCVREGKCIALSYVYSVLTLGMGILSVVYAFTSGTVTPAFVYPNSPAAVEQMTSETVFDSPMVYNMVASPAASVMSVRTTRSAKATKAKPKKVVKKKLKR